jgi:(S)-mandelate dehydrogenase
VATLDALPGVVQAAAGRIPVWMDGGVRRGQDIVKALALGAGGVLIGRATLFGAVSDGERGARRALEIVQTELVRTMQLCGVRQLNDITPDLLFSQRASL